MRLEPGLFLLRDRMTVGLPQGRLLIMAPHLDDAALSCAALIARSEPVDVLTVFAGEPDPPQRGDWDRITGFASSAESIPARLAEEQEAFAGTHHRLSTLRLLELQYVDEPRPRVEARVVAEAIRAWVAEGDGTVAIPVGAGWRPGRLRSRLERYWPPRLPAFHPDHVFVRDAALAGLRDQPRAPVLLYEELPYRFGGRAEREAARVSTAAGREAELIVATVDRTAKAKRIANYASQVPHLTVDGARLDDAGALPRDERYWLLRP